MKVSFINITARTNHPYYNRYDLHLFQATKYCLDQQTLTDFEWIIIDALYKKRENYFKNMKTKYTIKHIPAEPNHWHQQGLPGISTQYNKGIIHADGDILFFTGDSYLLPPNFIENLWIRYLKGYFSLAWYMFDNTYCTNDYKTLGDKNVTENPLKYNILGFRGNNLTGLEHRYVKLFYNTERKGIYEIPWYWWFGCSSASLEAMLKINGFDQNFDGDKMLLDTDVGSRLELAGYGSNLAMFNDFYLIRPTLNPRTYILKTYDDEVTIKCNHALTLYNRVTNNYRANTKQLTETDIEYIKTEICQKHCKMQPFCQKKHPWQYPFIHKEGYPSHNSSKKWYNYWLQHITPINLTEERNLRLDGEKYQEGTIIEP